MPLQKTTNLFMAGYRKDPPLLPRLPDNQPNFHRQSENIHTRDTHDTPFPKQRRTPESLKPQRSLLPQGFSQSQKTRNITITGNAITQYTNNYKSLSRSPDKQLKHNNERNRPPAITPYTEKNNHQNERNHILRQREQHTQFTNRNSRRIERSGRSEH